jgi:hypothetical protein
MAIQFFLAFFGSVLGCSIALAIVVKNLSEGVAASGKKPFVWGSLSAILTSLGGYLASYISSNLFAVFWILGGLFLLLGIIHIVFIHSKYFHPKKQNGNKLLFAEVLFGLSIILFAIVVFCSLQYFLKEEKNFLFYPVLMSSLLFFVPLLVFHAYQAAFIIPATIFPTWQYPLYQPIELPDDNSTDKEVVIGFEIAKKNTDTRKTYFHGKGPETMKLGEFFYHFINEYNDRYSETTIEYADKTSEAYEWWFHKKTKWYQAEKIYHPEMSIRENRIKDNTIIICERVLHSVYVTNTV